MDGMIRLPIGDIAEGVVSWLVANASGLFAVLRTVFKGMYDVLYGVLGADYFWIVPGQLAVTGMSLIIVLFAVIALLARGWVFAAGTTAGLLLIASVAQWDNAMATLSLVIVATFWALLISIPLGILAARSDGVSRVMRPILDFLQTMPAFVWLIPALVLLRVGVAPGIVATIIFALAPGVRMTELGIRGVDSEVVEAGHAFGSSPGRILRQIQLPLALPTIMAGVNQVIMLALSMVVIAGMVGAGGLGSDIVQSLGTLDTALGAEAGISVVIIAIVLDRLTGAFGKRMGVFAWIRERAQRRRGRQPLPAGAPAPEPVAATA
ncbi:ABC transporter permease subunit [Microbacterium paludicola]|uniref:ABC transporter permease subunit n=1 Tax=Microbacterium paludicola TaxID=300019 RepID=A0A4Y9FYQ7_9MICO|nr:ABC transporter permease subunit [Microbacterium paludicola]MBF0814927.1 ABC transporter permease subunit [Microbacterium paludicola]TFU34656.1 ABC transporter permease subunit [Microbacterium paludicola]